MERVAFGVILVVMAFAFAVYSKHHEQKVNQVVVDTEDAVSFICSTTTVLDDLVVQARDQIQGSLDNGTYARLLKQGVITRENIRNAKLVKAKYEVAHRELRLPNGCLQHLGDSP